MKITMIGKNDTWGIMLYWKYLLGDNLKYFMAHPAIAYPDLSNPNNELKQSLKEADVIIAQIAIRNQGLTDNLIINNVDIREYKDKTLIYFCSDREGTIKLKEYQNYYKGFRGYIALTPDVATILDIPYVPQPILPEVITNKYDKTHMDKILYVRHYHEIRGQIESSYEEINDFNALGIYFNKKYNASVNFQSNSMTLQDILACLSKTYFHLIYDNKSGCYSHIGLLSASRGVATISSLLPKYQIKFQEFADTFTLPFINVTNFSEFKHQMECLINNRDFIEHEGNRAGRWMEKFWNKEKHINNFNKVLRSFNFGG